MDDIVCDSESGVVTTIVIPLLVAILKGRKLSNVIQVVQERTLAGVECDVLLIYKPNHLPLATLEVKKAGFTAEQRKQVFVGLKKAKRSDSKNYVAG